MTSYISLLNKIEAFCNAHLQIKKYKGEFREQMPNFATTDEKYPVVFVVPTSDTETLELNQFTLDIYCVDIIQKDRANLNTIVSDCHLILKDLYLYFKDGSDLSVDVLTDPTMTPLNNFDLDYVAGWVMSITFEVEGYSVCAIPMNPIPPFTPSCEDATYEITDTDENALYSGSIVSGGNLDQTIQDSTAVLKDTDGNVLSTTSILAEGSEDIVAPDAVVNFQYEDGTPIQTVNYLSGSTQDLPLSNAYAENSDSSYTASEPYGTTIQLPDITVTDSNGSTYTQPSVTDVFCTPCEGVDVYVGEANVGTFPSGSDVFVKVIQDGLEVIPEDVTVVDDEVSIILADTPPCPDTNIEVNGVSEGSVPSGSTIDVQLSDSGGTVTPDSVTLVGTDLQIVLPDAGSPYDSDAQAFLTAAGISDLTISNAIDTFVKDLKTNGIWNKFYAIYPFVGGSAASHKWNLKDPRDLNAAFRLTFSGGLTHNANGITGNGLNGYADTYFNPVAQGINRENFGFTIYSRSASWGGYAMGVTDGASFSLFLRSGTTQYYGVFDDGSAVGTLANGNKTLTTQRSSNTQQTLYRDGSSALSLNTTTTKANVNYSFTLFCRNGAGGIQNFSAINTALHAFHTVLTVGEVSTFNTLVVNLQTALSRNV